MPLPEGHRVLVVGQVEDDASIKAGAGEVCTNAALLTKARSANPDAVLIYKPHPDVESGLRDGAFDARGIADVIATQSDITALLEQVQELWTMTSLTGFEALLRGVKVTTTGAPFYAGWGLTRDLGDVPPRRRDDISLEGLVHATHRSIIRVILTRKRKRHRLPCRGGGGAVARHGDVPRPG